MTFFLVLMTAKQLLSAFRYQGDKEKALSLLPFVSDPAGIRDSYMVHCAAYRGWTDVCRLLVEQYQVDPHCKTSNGETALHYAARNGWTDVCRLLVEQYQVDQHCKDSVGRTALHYAASNGWTDVCRLLVEQVDPHCRSSSGWTALHWASIYNHLDVVQYLVTSVCCDPLTESNVGSTPLSWSSGETRLFLQWIIG